MYIRLLLASHRVAASAHLERRQHSRQVRLALATHRVAAAAHLERRQHGRQVRLAFGVEVVTRVLQLSAVDVVALAVVLHSVELQQQTSHVSTCVLPCVCDSEAKTTSEFPTQQLRQQLIVQKHSFRALQHRNECVSVCVGHCYSYHLREQLVGGCIAVLDGGQRLQRVTVAVQAVLAVRLLKASQTKATNNNQGNNIQYKNL